MQKFLEEISTRWNQYHLNKWYTDKWYTGTLVFGDWASPLQSRIHYMMNGQYWPAIPSEERLININQSIQWHFLVLQQCQYWYCTIVQYT